MSKQSQSSVVSYNQSSVDHQLPLPITAVVLTLNEESNLEPCLRSIVGWTQTIVIVDSGSTDRTVEIAKTNGATFVHHAFESHAKQWEWALDHISPSSDWILALDADQLITSELQQELRLLFANGSHQLDAIDGLYINRRQIFRGKWIKNGGYYPKYLLKMFRRDKFVLDELDLVDHHFYVRGRTLKLKSDLIEENRKEDDITFWVDKHNRYAERFAKEDTHRGHMKRAAPIAPSFLGSPDQRVLWLKSLWSRLPLYVRPMLYFFYRYFIRLGFLDGKQGFIFHFMQGFWFRLLIDIKLDEARTREQLPR